MRAWSWNGLKWYGTINRVKRTSSHLQHRLLRGEVLYFTQENAWEAAFSAWIFRMDLEWGYENNLSGVYAPLCAGTRTDGAVQGEKKRGRGNCLCKLRQDYFHGSGSHWKEASVWFPSWMYGFVRGKLRVQPSLPFLPESRDFHGWQQEP